MTYSVGTVEQQYQTAFVLEVTRIKIKKLADIRNGLGGRG